MNYDICQSEEASIVLSVACLNADLGVECEPKLSHLTFMESDHEIISTVILTLLLIQEEQLSFTGESMCTSTR